MRARCVHVRAHAWPLVFISSSRRIDAIKVSADSSTKGWKGVDGTHGI